MPVSSGLGGISGHAPNQVVEKPLKLTLEDLYSGTTKKLKVTRKLLDASGKLVPTEKVLTINVKPGWKAGTKIKFQGEGDEMPNGQAQEIEFILEKLPHDRFIREGDNLKTFADIALDEALCGFS
jgi:DnaJ family protein B protein 4